MFEQKKQKWILTRLGNVGGSVSADGIDYDLHKGSLRQQALKKPLRKTSELTFRSLSGKLGDSEDSFLFCGVQTDPEKENFRLSATFTVTDTGGHPGWQAGYGIFAVDTLASAHHYARFRNLLSVGRHRGSQSRQYVCGLRAVAGYRDPGAEDSDVNRRMDPTRVFRKVAFSSELQTGERVRLTLKKTNRGFSVRVQNADHTDTLHFPGCDFLTVQEKKAIYVGFGIAGNLSLTVSDIRFHRSRGHKSHTPEKAIHANPPDYPFSRTLGLRPVRHGLRLHRRLFVSADGKQSGRGTRQSPLDLQTALTIGRNIMMLDGTYRLKTPVYIPGRHHEDGGVLRAEHAGKAVLDGADLQADLPVMILRGSGWHVEGLVFRGGPSVGLHLCGDNNRIERCTACENGDTGILICAWPGAQKEDWPKNNLVMQCDAFGNCDRARSNADGFGAKLSVGEGNRFSHCLAYGNIDDGFDLYTKRTIGPIGTVMLDHCVACGNGYRPEEGRNGSGSGFKLGGEGVPVAHVVVNCTAYENAAAGFFSNSNPAPRLHHLRAWNNGGQSGNNYKMNLWRPDTEPEWILEDLVSGEAEETAELILPERDTDGNLNADRLWP